MSNTLNFVELERERVKAEYRRREQECNLDLYAPWQPGESLIRNERKRLAARILHAEDVFPTAETKCLEIGYGTLGWLGDLISWGVRAVSLHGIEIEVSRARRAQEALPSADLRVGDATELPWENESFHLVVASTVFSSILDSHVREMVAGEIMRVMAPGGALLWYDIAVNNPKNPHVNKVGRRQIRKLFPELHGRIHSVTLAPPLARRLAERSWTLATLAGKIRFLRTHLLGVLIKMPEPVRSMDTKN